MELLMAILDLAIVSVGSSAAKQAIGIPMGFSVSVILLNIYMFTYEFEFVSRLITNAPHLRHHTKEFYRYVDDLGNFSDLDIRPFLTPLEKAPDSWDWIYPMAPWGPLSMTDQTERTQRSTTVVFLNLKFLLVGGILSYRWYDKIETYHKLHLPVCSYTHWASNLSTSSKLGTVKSQVRAIIIASSSEDSCMDGLAKLRNKFARIRYPKGATSATIDETYNRLILLMPVPFSPAHGVLVEAPETVRVGLSLSLF